MNPIYMIKVLKQNLWFLASLTILAMFYIDLPSILGRPRLNIVMFIGLLAWPAHAAFLETTVTIPPADVEAAPNGDELKD